MKNTVALLLIILLFSVGCSDSNDDSSSVNIRLKNVSSINFDKVQVGDQNHIHTAIASNSFSAYLEYNKAYRYAYIEIKSNTENFVLQPIDFVGETPLKNGYYTYELNVDESGSVILNFITD